MLDFPHIDAGAVAVAAAAPAGLPALPALTLKTAALAHFNALEQPLRTLAERYRAVAFDVSTPKGLDAARKARNELREHGRYAVQRAEDAFKSAANEAKKAVGPKVEELIAIIKPVEDHVHAQITAREEALIAEKAERDRKEAERIAGHESRLATLRSYVAKAQGLSAARIANGITAVEAIIIDPAAWEEFTRRAETAKLATLAELMALYETAKNAEAEAAERERQRIEQARIAEEQRIEAKRLKDAAEALAKQQREAAEELAREKAELDRQKADLEAKQRAAVQPDTTPEAQPIGTAETPDAGHVESAPPVLCEPTKPQDGDCLYAPRRVITIELDQAPAFVPPVPAPAPTLKLGQIGDRLGFTLTQAFVASLGFEPAGREKNAVLYHDAQFPLICDALSAHVLAKKAA
jgi:hypothetical protein